MKGLLVIFKELDPFHSTDKFAKAGRVAEEQMAFYLKRFFGDDTNCIVLNGIRLEAGGDAAQVDHLVIHSHGITIIESKSVHGKIQIKDDGQWIRWYGNQSTGVPSPLIQARLQEKFFRQLLGKASKNEELFARLPFNILVAISGSGVIIWPSSGAIPNVCKADQVPDKIIEAKRHLAEIKGLVITSENQKKLAVFLASAHKPLLKTTETSHQQILPAQPNGSATPSVAQVPPITSTKDTYVCKHCSSQKLEIRYAFSYFFYCLDCEKNTPIKALCPTCGEPSKLRKQKKIFFTDCETGSHSAPYFTNP